MNSNSSLYMRNLMRLCFLILTMSFVGCSRPHSSMTVAFDHHSPNKPVMLDTIFAMDAWLRQHGFQPSAEPGSSMNFVRHAGAYSPGMTDFWYRGAFHGSAPFYMRISLMPAPDLHIIGYFDPEMEGTDEEFQKLEGQAENFAKELKAYMQSLEHS